MKEYLIPVRYLPFEKQIKSARLLHLLTSFLFMFNAWIGFRQPTPPLLFVVSQIALSLIISVYVVLGKTLIKDVARSNFIFRLLETAGFCYASWYFFSEMNERLQGSLSIATLMGILYLMLMERKIFNSAHITLSEKGIRLPGLPKSDLLKWDQIENIRIRSDFASINTKDNRFLQYEINEVLSDAEIDEINAWGMAQFTRP
jgi:hypothetical protein